MKIKLLAACLLASYFLNAQNIFKEDMLSYTFSAPLHEQGLWSHNNDASNGGYGAGACNPAVSGQICNSANVIFTSVSYPDYGSSTNSLEVGPFLDNPGHPLTPVVTDGVLYVGMVINMISAPVGTATTDFFRAANSDTSLITFRLLIQDAGTGYRIGVKKGNTGNPTVYSDTVYTYGEDVLVILKYTHLSEVNDDIFDLFVNPTYASGEPATPTATTSTGIDQSGNIDRIFFRLGFNNINALPSGNAGLVSAARTWFDLGFIPLSVNQFDTKNFSVYSNKASKGLLSITSQMALNNATLSIYTITGQLLETKKINLNESNNDIAINPIHENSVYIVELKTENGNKFSKKIIVN